MTGSRTAIRYRKLAVGLLALLLIGSGLVLATPAHGAPSPAAVPAASSLTLAELLAAPRAPAPFPTADQPVSGSRLVGTSVSTRSIPVLVTLSLSNQSALNSGLSALSDPNSPSYHRYLTADQFDARYSPSGAAYANAIEYFDSFDVQQFTTFADRISIAFDVSPTVADAMFDTSLQEYSLAGATYFAPSAALELPAPIAASVAQVQGLSSNPDLDLSTNLHLGTSSGPVQHGGQTTVVPDVAGYLPPPNYGSSQEEYGPDFQVAYDEQSLFTEYGFPTNATVATILWAGNYTGPGATTNGECGSHSVVDNEGVGPFDPADVDGFFNETLPAGQPHSEVTAVPIEGAVEPGCLASWDTSGAVVENTLDLEMVGSTAPGAHIYNVYGTNGTSVDVDTAFTTILNPDPLFPGLANVSVISNSWGGADGNDTSWFTSLEEAQMRGISVLAGSGDSDDSPSSSKWTGTTVEFPSSMAYDSFGVTAVGGTTVTLNPTSLEIESQVVWSDLSSAGGPYGSTGGNSTVFAEPSWQRTTEANSVILGAGRGVPDLAGLANNTLLTYTSDGYQFQATNASSGGGRFAFVAGTSIASPLTAGLVATIDHALNASGEPALGFLDPVLYATANEQEAVPVPAPAEPIGAFDSVYNSVLPTLPFYDVAVGGNELNSADPGYDLASGWGSLDAYNYTMYVLLAHSDGVVGRLSGVQDEFNLTGLAVTSVGSDSGFNASTQQNFFLANSLGAPVYWIQNVVYINGTPGDWSMNFTGWVVWPFYGLYPSESIYEFNFPLTGLVEPTPIDFDFETQLINTSSLTLTPTVVYTFGVAGTPTLYLPVPGAAYIMGSQNYSYSWKGVTYTNGPYPGGTYPEGFLAPQFGLVGGPSLGVGEFGAATAGNLTARIEPYGTSHFYPAGTTTLTLANTQTGEQAENLNYAKTGDDAWTLGYLSGSSTQGIVQYEDAAEVPGYYTVEFNQSGVPAGVTWWVNLTGGPDLSALGATGHVATYLGNGTYPWTAAMSFRPGTVSPSNGSLVVNGADAYVDLTFTVPNDTVTFQQSGLPSGLTWSVKISGVPLLSGAAYDQSTRLDYGGYSFVVNGPNATWLATPRSGTFSVGAAPTSILITFSLVVFPVTLDPTFSGSGPVAWSVVIGGTTVNGTGANETVRLPNGTYAFEIHVPPGYTASPASGNASVNGEALAVPFLISGHPSTSSGLSSEETLLLLLLVVVVVVVAIIAVVRRRRSSGPPTPPPGVYAGSFLPPPPTP
ncbi:MAG: protease pro-enzyme activation domain-containing protein [Thermoplasmata archaeon]